MTPDDPRHGTYAGGRLHRNADQKPCEPCRRAEARYEQARQLDLLNGRPRSMSATGTMRRLQALVALGHTFARIAEALDMSQAGAHALATRPKAYVRATTATQVVSLYDAWCMTLPAENTGTERKGATYARTVARKRHWAPPLAWDDIDNDPAPHHPTAPRSTDLDHVVVARIIAGDHTLAHAATTAERRVITDAWVAKGRSLKDLERLTGWRPDRYLTRTEGEAA